MVLFSPKQWVQSRLDDGYYTPDNAKLFRKQWHPVFVYGTLRDGFYRNRLLADCPKVGSGTVSWRLPVLPSAPSE